MKPLSIVVLFFFLAGKCMDSFGQEMYEYDPSTRELKRLEAQKADVIRFSDIAFGTTFWRDTLKGIGPVLLRRLDFFLYRKGKDVFVEKMADYIEARDDGGLGRVISKPIKISQDTVFDWLSTMIDSLKGEDIFPYIYQVTYNGRTFYMPVHTFHEQKMSLLFTINRQGELEQSSVGFDEYALDPKRFGTDPPNLNYPYNISTGWYKLYNIFQDIISKYNNSFEFVK